MFDHRNYFQMICRQCLLEEMASGMPLRHLIDEWIDVIPIENKVSDDVYRERLAICKRCDELANGLCKQCGCYVEYRAAIRIRRCPTKDSRWER